MATSKRDGSTEMDRMGSALAVLIVDAMFLAGTLEALRWVSVAWAVWP